jgi:hypothetical protein
MWPHAIVNSHNANIRILFFVRKSRTKNKILVVYLPNPNSPRYSVKFFIKHFSVINIYFCPMAGIEYCDDFQIVTIDK